MSAAPGPIPLAEHVSAAARARVLATIAEQRSQADGVARLTMGDLASGGRCTEASAARCLDELRRAGLVTYVERGRYIEARLTGAFAQGAAS